jgi:hypothetical protein
MKLRHFLTFLGAENLSQGKEVDDLKMPETVNIRFRPIPGKSLSLSRF